MMEKIINVNLKNSPYNVYIKDSIMSRIPHYLRQLEIGDFCVILTHKKILSLHKKRIASFLEWIPHIIIDVEEGEKAKSGKWMFHILSKILKVENIKQKIFIACLGGGVITDLGGFIASVYKRGIPHIQIPTTLLAQVDASIGGKTAINLEQAKNMVGTFYQPKAVFIDPQFLHTLKARELAQGFAEIIKYAAIKDKTMFTDISLHYNRIAALNNVDIIELIEKCVKIKAAIVVKDEKEKLGLRTLLNFGHTIGHALESSCNYEGGLTHGEGVSLGMICAGFISSNLGLCSSKDTERLCQLIKMYGLPERFSFDTQKVLRAMIYDKKFVSNSIRMVLLEKIGRAAVFENVPLKLVKISLKQIQKQRLRTSNSSR